MPRHRAALGTRRERKAARTDSGPGYGRLSLKDCVANILRNSFDIIIVTIIAPLMIVVGVTMLKLVPRYGHGISLTPTKQDAELGPSSFNNEILT